MGKHVSAIDFGSAWYYIMKIDRLIICLILLLIAVVVCGCDESPAAEIAEPNKLTVNTEGWPVYHIFYKTVDSFGRTSTSVKYGIRNNTDLCNIEKRMKEDLSIEGKVIIVNWKEFPK